MSLILSPKGSFLFLTLCACLLGFGACLTEARAQAPAAAPAVDESLYLQEKLRTNAGAVSIMVSGLNCTCTQFAEDIRNVVNELRPDGQRALISLGEGGPHNLKDSIFLLGVHMTIVDENNLKLLKESDPVVYGDVDEKIRYITKLYNAEFHILARDEIKSVTELDGKSVNVELVNSQTDLVASKIFDTLGIKINAVHDDDTLAQEKLLRGEISAMVLSTGAPQESLVTLKKSDGVHFLPLDKKSVAGRDFEKIKADYLPAELTSEYYPNLIDQGEIVPTVASRMVLAIYNWPENGERYRRNTRFIDVFFSRIDKFRDPSRHPKWKEVNIAAEVPGWTRFKPAQQWLDRHLKTASVSAPAAAPKPKPTFDDFLARRAAEGANRPMSAGEREALFAEFQKYLHKQGQ